MYSLYMTPELLNYDIQSCAHAPVQKADTKICIKSLTFLTLLCVVNMEVKVSELPKSPHMHK